MEMYSKTNKRQISGYFFFLKRKDLRRKIVFYYWIIFGDLEIIAELFLWINKKKIFEFVKEYLGVNILKFLQKLVWGLAEGKFLKL